MEKKVQVGQKVWVKFATWSNRTPREPQETTVETVGNKYFTLVDRYREKYDVNTLRQVADTNYLNQVYLSLQTILDEEEHSRLSEEVRKVFSGYGKVKLTLTQLRNIKAILDEK